MKTVSAIEHLLPLSSLIVTLARREDIQALDERLASGCEMITCHVMPGVHIRGHLHSSSSWSSRIEVRWIVERDASVTIDCFLQDAHITRMYSLIELAQPGASVHLSVLSAISSHSSCTIETVQHHTARATESSVLVTSLVGDHAQTYYKGTITIAEKAHGSRAKQLHNSCLLTPTSRAHSVPALEALTDDVSCAHGSATGPLNKNHLWFLTTRGYTPDQAAKSVLRAFLASGLQDVSTCAHATYDGSVACVDRSLDRLIAIGQGTV